MIFHVGFFPFPERDYADNNRKLGETQLNGRAFGPGYERQFWGTRRFMLGTEENISFRCFDKLNNFKLLKYCYVEVVYILRL